LKGRSTGHEHSEGHPALLNRIVRWLRRFYIGLVFLFLYAPVAVLIAFSFNKTRSRSLWGGFTFDWYRKLFENQDIIRALQVTLIVAILSAVIATSIATITCIGLNSMKQRWRQSLLNMTYIPNGMPDLVTGIALMLLFYFATIELGFATLLLAHIAFNVPFAVLSIMPKLKQLDRNIFEAALDLGATPGQAIRKVILPEISPGIVTAMILTFTISIDDFVISYFTSGTQVSTLAVLIYSMARKRVNPQINALSTLLFLTVLILLIIINMRSSNERRKTGKGRE
jgi:spermidine/putrescine transport system permease protein